MRNLLPAFIVVAALLLVASPLMAQRQRNSPHETVSTIVEGNYQAGTRVMLVYGRPYTKHPRTGEVRKIWGGLVPFGKVWRTGADEATLLIAPATLEMGGATIPPGAYTLFTLPQEDGSAKLIINKQIGQWGTQYDEKQDLARVDLKKDALDTPVEQFTMAIERTGDGGAGVLKMMWENVQYSIPFTIKK